VTLGELPEPDLAQRLRGDGVALDFGLARARVRAEVDAVPAMLRRVYGAFPATPPDGFFDMTVALVRARGLRRFVRPQIEFLVDGGLPFEPFPADTPLPLLEWGMNWCVANRCHHHLLLHAGVVERSGIAVVMPAVPGSGKSTLVAALMHRGYRLLSDEFGAVRLDDGRLTPAVRPIALKNESIGVIGAFAPDAVIGPTFPKTRKGDVAHAAPTTASVTARDTPAAPGLVLFPRYAAGAALDLEPVEPARAFVKLSGNSFNYELLGPDAFRAVARLVRACDAFRLTYSDLDQAIGAVDGLIDARRDGVAGRRAAAH
jgi:hypothetical protein